MASKTQSLSDSGLIHPPKFVPSNMAYETIMGSQAYGVATDDSDLDIYGFCVPPRDVVFPHLAGEIVGFGRQKKRFEQFQQHHVQAGPEVLGGARQYDLSIYNIVKYFSLCMENNPNMIDSLFTPADCVLHITEVGDIVRTNRRLFLHTGSWHKFKGYAYSQLHKMASKHRTGKRKEEVEEHGFDRKFAYHTVRLLYEAEMIMAEADIDMRRHREHLKAIRRGDVSAEEIRQWASCKEKSLEALYESSPLRHSPDEAKVKGVLLDCLEHHYGSLEACLVDESVVMASLREIRSILDRLPAS